jgi:hypothetical protein
MISQEQKKKLIPKALPFTIIQRQMYKHGHDQVLRGNVHLDQIPTILQEMHKDVRRDHFSIDIIARKIMDAKYWHSTILLVM